MPLTAIKKVVDSLDSPAAAVDAKGAFLCINPPFHTTFGAVDPGMAMVCDFFPAVSPKVDICSLMGGKNIGWHGAELPLQAKGQGSLFWVEVLSFETVGGVFLRLLTFHDMRGYHELEAAYLSRIRHIADDNVWILNPAATLIWARTDSAVLDAYVGRPAHDLILLEDRRIWMDALRQAKENPGCEVECVVRGALHGNSRVIDLCYLTGGPWGGRYYAASRETDPSGGRVVRRLKEAWQVNSHASLAAKLGTTGSSISRASRQQDVPSAWLVSTADGTGVSMDWLRYGHGEKWRVKM